MRFDGIDCQGEFLIDRVPELPVWSSAYEGRMIYTEDTERFYIGINNDWRLLAKTTDEVDLTATAAEINTACTGITASAGELNYMDGITSPLIHSAMVRGGLSRSRFEWAGNDEVSVHAGMYHHMAQTQEQIVYWDSTITVPVGYTYANDWYYLYLDSSAIQSYGTPHLTTFKQFQFTVVEPVWSDTRNGFYNGYDRCIFAVQTDGSRDFKKFYHDGGEYVIYDVNEIDLWYFWFKSSAGWLTQTLTAPNFGDGAQVLTTFYAFTGKNTRGHRPGDGYYRKKGSGSGGHIFQRARSKYYGSNVNQATVTVNEDQQIEISWAGNETAAWHLMTDGYVLPGGM